MNDVRKMGRVTIPTDTDAVSETLNLLKRWGADAIRDCDGTEFPQELKDTGAKIYATYYTTRKDNAWAKANPDETQQCYIMTPFYTAEGGALTIPLMTGISRELMKVNDHDDIARWWEVMDRTTGEPVPTADWHYDAARESVVIDPPAAYHEYTVSFLAYLIWDPVHMYNSVINDWKDVEHQIPFDVRQPKTHAYTLRRLREYLESHPYVNVVRFTTFFHLFTLVFDELRREKYVDWYGYSASVCPYILEQFEKEVGYKFRPEFIIDQGYYNNQYRVPSKEYKDFQAFQRREVAGLMKEMTDIVHDTGFGQNRPVDVVLRPEDVDLVKPEEGIIDGVVTHLIFKGVHYEMEVMANGYEWLVHSTDCFPVGTKVGISVDPFDIQIMNKPESEDEEAANIEN